jgi:hypothetical protein
MPTVIGSIALTAIILGIIIKRPSDNSSIGQESDDTGEIEASSS